MGDGGRSEGEAQGGRGKAQGSSPAAAGSTTGTGDTAAVRSVVAGRAGQATEFV